MRHVLRLLTTCATLLAGSTMPAGAQQASGDYTAPYQRKALEVYRTIVGMRTAAGQGQVPAMAACLAEQFRAGGFPAEDVHVLPLTLPDGEATAGLVVRYRGDGSSGKRPILLLAHMDVVDARREDWTRDPFRLVEEGGYFFGRGSADDKFGVASLTATFLRLEAEGFVPTRDLVIAFSGDEETGMLSARSLVTTHRALTDAEFALNDDGGGGMLDEATGTFIRHRRPRGALGRDPDLRRDGPVHEGQRPVRARPVRARARRAVLRRARALEGYPYASGRRHGPLSRLDI